jgi:hypothetical protein
MDKEERIYQEGLDRLYDRLKQDPLFDLRVEFGKFLMRHIDSFTPAERKRYDELSELLTSKSNTGSQQE